MNYEVISLSDDEIDQPVLQKVPSYTTLNDRKSQQTFSSQSALAALNSYRNQESFGPVIVDVHSLAGGQAPLQSQEIKPVFKKQLKRRVSSIASIEESIEACVKRHAYDEPPVPIEIDISLSDTEDGNGMKSDNCSTDVRTSMGYQSLSEGQCSSRDSAVHVPDEPVNVSNNTLLFKEFLSACSQFEDDKKYREKAQVKLGAYFEKTRKEFIESEQFASVIKSEISILTNKSLYSCIKNVLDTLKLHQAVRRVPLHPAPCTSGASSLDGETTSSATTDYLHQNDVANCENRDKVVKLQFALEELSKKIKSWEEAEVDLNDETDSSYLRVHRYKERFVKIHAELCKLTGQPTRVLKKKIRFNGTSFPEANVLIERWLNKTDSFPDFNDVVEILKSNNLEISQTHLHSIAAEVFRTVGDHLQQRRQRELWNLQVESLELADDPAKTDSDLRSKLEANRKLFRDQEQALINKFVEKQLAKQAAGPCKESDESDDTSSDAENVVVVTKTGDVCDQESIHKNETAVLSEPACPKMTINCIGDEKDVPGQEAVVCCRREEAPDKPCVIELNYFTVKSNFLKHQFNSHFGFNRNSLPKFFRPKDKVLKDNSNLLKNSKTSIKWGDSWRSDGLPFKWNNNFADLNRPVNKKIGLLPLLVGNPGFKTHGGLTTGAITNNSSQTDSAGKSNSVQQEGSVGSINTGGGGAADDGDKDDDDNKRKKLGKPDCIDEISQQSNDEDAQDNNKESEKTEMDETGCEMNQESNLDDINARKVALENASISDDANSVNFGDEKNENSASEVINETTDPLSSIQTDNEEDQAIVNTASNIEGEPNNDSPSTSSGVTNKSENVKSDVELNAPLVTSNGGVKTAPSEPRDEPEALTSRLRKRSSLKPQWIDNGEDSESSNSNGSRDRDSLEDPDFTVKEAPVKSKERDINCKSFQIDDSKSKNSNLPLIAEGSKTMGIQISSLIFEDSSESAAQAPATGLEKQCISDDDNDDIEVISESIVNKPVAVTPQQRVDSFLANASKFAITVTRKRPMSRETKEALTQLKKLKNINISSTRLDKSLQEVSFVNNSPRGESSSSATRQSPAGRTGCSRIFSQYPTPLSTGHRHGPAARGSSSRLPIISNVQSFQTSSPVITGVRGALPTRRTTIRGRGSILPGVTIPSRMMAASIRPSLARGVQSTRQTRGRFIRGSQPVLRGRGTTMLNRARGMRRPTATTTSPAPVPFVLIE